MRVSRRRGQARHARAKAHQLLGDEGVDGVAEPGGRVGHDVLHARTDMQRVVGRVVHHARGRGRVGRVEEPLQLALREMGTGLKGVKVRAGNAAAGRPWANRPRRRRGGGGRHHRRRACQRARPAPASGSGRNGKRRRPPVSPNNATRMDEHGRRVARGQRAPGGRRDRPAGRRARGPAPARSSGRPRHGRGCTGRARPGDPSGRTARPPLPRLRGQGGRREGQGGRREGKGDG